MVLRDQENFVFYVKNYIDWNLLNQLYYPDLIKKDIRNADVVICKLELMLIRAINQRLEVAKKVKRKKEEIIEKLKIEVMTAKCQRRLV